MLTNKQFDQFKKELTAIIDIYKKEFSQQKPTDWKTYEKQWANRLRTALKEIKPLTDQAAAMIRANPKPFGKPPNTSAKQKVLILLAKDLAQFSNRKMANLLPLFAALLGDADPNYARALEIMNECGVKPKSIRLDQNYAGQSTTALFGAETSMYLIPKRNATIKGSYAWKDTMRDFMFYPFLFLREYFRREHSESGFSSDKRCNGWKIWQKREDRIHTATMLKGVWHNLLWLGE